MTRIAADPEAFDAFYRGHIEAIQRFVARRVDDPYLAADLTADIFLAAISSAHTYRAGRSGARAWLYGVARNVVAAQARQRYRERNAVQRLSGRRLVEEDDVARLVARIDAQAQARTLYAAMERLSDKERAVLELVALEDMTPRQVADVLGIKPITVRVRLYRARRLLQEHLNPSTAPETAELPLTSEVTP